MGYFEKKKSISDMAKYYVYICWYRVGCLIDIGLKLMPDINDDQLIVYRSSNLYHTYRWMDDNEDKTKEKWKNENENRNMCIYVELLSNRFCWPHFNSAFLCYWLIDFVCVSFPFKFWYTNIIVWDCDTIKFGRCACACICFHASNHKCFYWRNKTHRIQVFFSLSLTHARTHALTFIQQYPSVILIIS